MVTPTNNGWIPNTSPPFVNIANWGIPNFEPDMSKAFKATSFDSNSSTSPHPTKYGKCPSTTHSSYATSWDSFVTYYCTLY